MSLLGSVTPKDPGETRKYSMDWTAGLNSGATISASTWTVPSGLTGTNLTEVASGDLIANVTLAGGTDGQDYELVNTITTSDGETLVQSGRLQVRKATQPLG